jgi:hypothetical protein
MRVQDEAAIEAIEEAVAWHTVGIAHSLDGKPKAAIGTGAVVRWRTFVAIITAHHVIRETDLGDFGFFFRPSGTFLRGHPDDQSLRNRLQYYPAKDIAISEVVENSALDLAALIVPADIAEREMVRPFEIDSSSAVPSVGDVVLLRGHPKDLARQLGPGMVATFATHEWTTVTDRRPGGCKPDASEFFIEYTSADDWLPHGFSGGGIWYHTRIPDEPVWRPNLGLA